MKQERYEREESGMGKNENSLYIKFPAIPENERLSRTIAAAFLMSLNPTLEEMEDVKTAVSEAVTNCIIHAYEEKTDTNRERAVVDMFFSRNGQECSITITDYGKGIQDIKKAMEPLYTTKAEEERSGMGFSFMEAFMDELEVESEPGKGTTVRMMKKFGEPMIGISE